MLNENEDLSRRSRSTREIEARKDRRRWEGIEMKANDTINRDLPFFVRESHLVKILGKIPKPRRLSKLIVVVR